MLGMKRKKTRTDNGGPAHTSHSNEQILGHKLGDEALVHGHSHILQEEACQEDVHGGACHCEVGSEGIVGVRAAHVHSSVCHSCEGCQVDGRALRLQLALQEPAAIQHAWSLYIRCQLIQFIIM